MSEEIVSIFYIGIRGEKIMKSLEITSNLTTTSRLSYIWKYIDSWLFEFQHNKKLAIYFLKESIKTYNMNQVEHRVSKYSKRAMKWLK